MSPRLARPGHVISRLPMGNRRVWHRKVPYYYFGGVFYKSAPSGFIVVSPPIGAVVVSLPIGYQRVWIGDVGYYVYGGVFYQRVPSGYVVVEGPTNLAVEDEPPVLVQPKVTVTGNVSVTASVLNVRTGPSLRHSVIYQIQKGYILEVHGKENGWLYVQLPDGEFGWVMSEFTTWLKSPGSG